MHSILLWVLVLGATNEEAMERAKTERARAETEALDLPERAILEEGGQLMSSLPRTS